MSKIENERVQVWFVTQRAEESFRHRTGRSPHPEEMQWPADYTHVATLEVADLDDAFKRTNNIDSSWLRSSGVEVNEAGCEAAYMFGGWSGKGIRSCSTGDIFRSESTGAKYRVASRWFDRVYANHLWHEIAGAFSKGKTSCPHTGRNINPLFQKRFQRGDNIREVPCVLFNTELGVEIEVDWLDFTDLVDSGAIDWLQYFSDGISEYYPRGRGGRLLKTEYRLASYRRVRELFNYIERSSFITAFSQGA